MIEGYVLVLVVVKFIVFKLIKGVVVLGMFVNLLGMGKMDGKLVIVDFVGKVFF